MTDQIHLTVAAVVERDGKYLCVTEYSDDKLVYNQPAGHVEQGEKLQDAAIREALEETGWHISPTGLISLSTYTAPSNGITYYRVCFAATAVSFDPNYKLDTDIVEALWLSHEELQQRQQHMRSPLVLQAVEGFRSGAIYPLSILHE